MYFESSSFLSSLKGTVLDSFLWHIIIFLQPAKPCASLNCVTLPHFGTSQNWKLSLSECLKVRCGIWLICLCELAVLLSQSGQLSEISTLWRHVAPTFCPAKSAVPVLVIAWGRSRRCDPDVQCLIETRTQPLNCKHCFKYHLHKRIKDHLYLCVWSTNAYLKADGLTENVFHRHMHGYWR